MSSLPIAEYALLSDCRSAALVSRAGSVDWLCFPRFDGPSIFARLLDERAGHWSISVKDAIDVRRRYVPGTMILETTFRTSTGTAVLLDAMVIGRNERGHELGVASPGILLRSVSCQRGTVQIALEYAPRLEYGLISPLLRPVEGGILARGGADVLLLSSSPVLSIDGSIARTTFTLSGGEQASFALQHRASWEPIPQLSSQEEIAGYLHNTIVGWRTWSELHQHYEGPWRDLVHHSGRVLQALTFRPTGAIVAAPTTSLPESIGGERNWDYRYTWIRDSCLTLEALWVAACPDEALWFFAWMAGAVETQIKRGAELQIMFGVGGEHDLSERSLDHLAGWRASRPVRVGNGAWQQRQLDVYGELLSAARRLRAQLDGLDETTRNFLIEVADAAASRWQQRDQGIWEVRGEPRDFLYSKLMCWMALDSAIDIADILHAQDRVAAWSATREQIRDAILRYGWSEKAQAFTQAFGSDDLDASVLMMAITGFLPATDPRMRSTIDAIAERLTDEHGLVYRYRATDGLAGDEGTFLLCTFWLAHAQALAGELDRARTTFAQAIAYANDVGLLAEEVDPATNELLGNFPQAFSHIGLVNAAWAISQAE
ncbi:MAG TPA: glycoside hydrolase family 15 protein [Ktedonobacteraceae bacterium]|jgi:GH15 family glucan-1,4-alpha-glucosidase|nr:glycoside hydrolase family 15 protein [Ktedonobacteraceae bacterium]